MAVAGLSGGTGEGAKIKMPSIFLDGRLLKGWRAEKSLPLFRGKEPK
jgi:hypothetical protein